MRNLSRLLVVLFAFLIVPFVYADDGSISAKTDKSSYHAGDTITISGKLVPPGNDAISMTIKNVDTGEMIAIGQFNAKGQAPNQTFTYQVKAMGPLWNDGTHVITLGSDGRIAEIHFEFVAESVKPEPVTSETPEVKTKPQRAGIPDWIKNNAKWWSQGNIDDDTFVSGIEFLINQKIVNIPDLPESASEKARPSFVDSSKDPQHYIDRYQNEPKYKEWFDANYPDYTIFEAVGLPQPIPGWIKNNAEWWSEGMISEDDFVSGIEYLVEKGILRV